MLLGVASLQPSLLVQSHLSLHLDHVEVDVLAVEVGDGKNGVDGNLGHLAPVNVDNLGVKGGLGSGDEGLSVLLGELDGVSNLSEGLEGDLAGSLVSLGNTDRVDSPVEELRGGAETRSEATSGGGSKVGKWVNG